MVNQLDTTYLEVNHNKHDDDGGEQIAQVWSTLPLERLEDSLNRVSLREEEVDKSDDGSLELSALVGPNSDWREALPHDGLADVGGDEQTDSTAKAIALLKQLV